MLNPRGLTVNDEVNTILHHELLPFEMNVVL